MPRTMLGCLRAAACLVATAATVIATGGAVQAEQTPTGVAYHRITFPVAGAVHYSDDFGDCREGCTRHHMGNDLMGAKLMREVAANAGTISWVRDDASGTSGNMLQLRGTDGWDYWYIHINNDTPGTDDGANPAKWRFAPGIHEGAKVKAGQFLAYMGDSGDAEDTQAHLHFEIHPPDSGAIDPYTSLRLAQGQSANGLCSFPSNPVSRPALAGGAGYWMLTADGAVDSFGSAKGYGDAHAAAAAAGHNDPSAVAIAPTATGKGYWIADSLGAIRAFGDAHSYGSTAEMHLNASIIGMSTTPSGKGYWLLAKDGGIFTFGDASFYGSTGALQLNAPIIAMAATTTGHGYWLLASDGGVFSFGDAHFFGSTGAQKLNSPVIGMGAAAGGKGYWLLARDGGMFSFGEAGFHGSLPGLGWCPGPTSVAFTATLTGLGYWVVLADGRVVPFGDAKYFGDAPASAHPVSFAVSP